MDKTVDRIVKASSLPLSIVIVGVGGADFSAMVCINYVYGKQNCSLQTLIVAFFRVLNVLNK